MDPELMSYIKAIYGGANLSDETLMLLQLVWKTNPEFIRSKAAKSAVTYQRPSLGGGIKPEIPKLINKPKVLEDDLRGITSFGAAFKEARRRGLKLFRWGKGVYGTLLASGMKSGAVQSGNLVLNKQMNKPLEKSTALLTKEPDMKTTIEFGDLTMMNPFTYVDPNTRRREIWINLINPETGEWDHDDLLFVKPPKTDMYGNKLTPEQLKNLKEFEPVYRTKVRYQQGGTMNNLQELQKAFMAYLIQDAAARGILLQSELDLQKYAEQLGEEGLKAKYLEFMQKMQGGVMARFGAKLQYYKKLKGACPEGEKLVYFRSGGRLCKVCQKAEGGIKTKKTNEIDKFKKGRELYRKDMKSAKDEAARDSVAINKYNDQETMSYKGHKGNFKNGKWVPDRKKYSK